MARVAVYSLVLPVFWFFSKDFFITAISREGILSRGSFKTWEQIPELKRRNQFGITYLTIENSFPIFGGFHISLKKSQLPGFKFAVQEFAKTRQAPERDIIKCLDEINAMEETSGKIFIHDYNPKKSAKISIRKLYFLLFLVIGFAALSSPTTVSHIFSHPYGQPLYRFLTNTTHVREGETYFGIEWPEGTLIYRGLKADEIYQVQIKSTSKFLHGKWPKDTSFNFLKNELSFAIVTDEFELAGSKFPKNSHVNFSGPNIELVYLGDKWVFNGKIYPASSLVQFKNNLPHSVKLPDCTTVSLAPGNKAHDGIQPCEKSSSK